MIEIGLTTILALELALLCWSVGCISLGFGLGWWLWKRPTCSSSQVEVPQQPVPPTPKVDRLARFRKPQAFVPALGQGVPDLSREPSEEDKDARQYRLERGEVDDE